MCLRSVHENGLFTDRKNDAIRYGTTGRPTGGRYRYISDEEANDKNRYFYLDENNYKNVSSRYKGSLAAITANGTIAAQITQDYGAAYFATDLLGSIRTVTDTYGTSKASYTYDAFGTMLKTDSLSAASDSIPVEFGYLGKHLDPTAKLYNYGFRDYSPSSARFTTVDPIRDGTNWFAYCGGDPVNFVDLWGLESGDKSYVDNVVEYFIPDGNGARYKKNRAKTTGIVIHYTAGAYLGKDGKEHAQTPIETINYWIKQESTNAHYVIGENGEIYQAIPKNEIGQHAGNGGIYKIKDGITEKLNGHPNARTIGIEMENIDRKTPTQPRKH